jgi:hypothetical protein
MVRSEIMKTAERRIIEDLEQRKDFEGGVRDTLFRGEKEHPFVRRFPGFARSSFSNTQNES